MPSVQPQSKPFAAEKRISPVLIVHIWWQRCGECHSPKPKRKFRTGCLQHKAAEKLDRCAPPAQKFEGRISNCTKAFVSVVEMNNEPWRLESTTLVLISIQANVFVAFLSNDSEPEKFLKLFRAIKPRKILCISIRRIQSWLVKYHWKHTPNRVVPALINRKAVSLRHNSI